MIQRSIFQCCFLATCLAVSSSIAASALPSKGRVVILGDSNTYAAHYVNLLEASILTQAPDVHLEILNLGLPSETTSGLSEPEHPFPRPTVHERLDRVLAKTHPDVVVACYGMNDGIYYPQSEERFAAFKAGINLLIEKVHQSGTKLYLLTPPPFDPVPQQRKAALRPKGADKYAWFSIYEDYDSVLADYSAWILSLQDDRITRIIDIRSPMLAYLNLKRQTEPDFVMSGDGVHFNEVGHSIIARALLREWGFDPDAAVDPEVQKLVSQRQTLLRDAWLSHCGYIRPNTRAGLPLEEAQAKAAELWTQIEGKLGR